MTGENFLASPDLTLPHHRLRKFLLQKKKFLPVIGTFLVVTVEVEMRGPSANGARVGQDAKLWWSLGKGQ